MAAGLCEATLQAEAAALRAATLVYADAELMVELVAEEELHAAFSAAGAGEHPALGLAHGCLDVGWLGQTRLRGGAWFRMYTLLVPAQITARAEGAVRDSTASCSDIHACVFVVSLLQVSGAAGARARTGSQ